MAAQARKKTAHGSNVPRPAITRESLLTMIDNTILDTSVPVAGIAAFCRQSAEARIGAVAVNSSMVGIARKAVSGTDTRVCAAIGFPLGAASTFSKVAESVGAVAAGADELDFVINVNMVKSREWSYLENETAQIVRAAGGRTTKLILETALLSRQEILRLCDIAVGCGITFVKTSTGFHEGATVPTVRLIRKRVGDRCGIKAAGGIHTLADVTSLVAAGADRIGTSKGFTILEEFGSS